MHIVQIATEFAPIIKAGGLADVLHGLSCELIRQNHTVQVIVPYYEFLENASVKIEKTTENLILHEKNAWHNNSIHRAEIDKIEVLFIEMHHPEKYFSRENIYGYEDDIPRFIYFSRVATEFLLNQKKRIDILHLHDWHTSLCAIFAKDVLSSHQLKIKGIILTVHNFHYQGKCASIDLDNIGLEGKKYLTPSKLQDPNASYSQSINLLKGGIVFSDAFTTVSPTYAKELLENLHTYGLEKVIQTYRKKLYGILNGIDECQWNPKNDHYLSQKYSKDDVTEQVFSSKRQNKISLYHELSLQEEEKPLFIFIGRLVKQKGIELLEPAIPYILEKGGNLILCGSAIESSIQKRFEDLQKKYQDTQNIHFHFDYNEALTRRLYAGADFILVPSLFEPCGLVQLIAMRYGTIPIARKTGGLSDSVIDIENKGYGFLFEDFTEESLFFAIDRAFTYYQNKDRKQLFHHVMQLDFSWKNSTKEYIALYQK